MNGPKAILIATLIASGPISGTLSAAPFVPARHAQCVAVSRDGKWAVLGYSGQSNEAFHPRPHPNPRKCGVVEWYDVQNGRRMHRKETFGDLTRVDFSRDGRYVAASRLYATADRIALNEVRVWDVATGEPLLALDRCHAFAFPNQSDCILVVSRRRCVKYELATGKKLFDYRPLANASSLTVSVDGDWIGGVVQEEGQSSIRLCRRGSSELVASTIGFPQHFYVATFVPGRQQLVSGHRGFATIWSVPGLLAQSRVDVAARGLQHPFVSPDGNVLGLADQSKADVSFWDLQTGSFLKRYTFEQGSLLTYYPRVSAGEPTPEKAPFRFCFSADGEAFLAGPHGGILRLLANGQDVGRLGN